MADAPAPFADATVMLLAHGSEAAASGADQARTHAADLQATGKFRRVIAAFLRDEPTPADGLDTFPEGDVYVVPFMAGEGYSLERLIPDALAQAGSRIRMCRAVGAHPAVPNWAFDHLADYAVRNALPMTETSVLIVAHGTNRNPDNFDRAREAVKAVEERGVAAHVDAVFLDQEPRVGAWRDHVRPGHVLVLPYLMALGRHGRHDIPDALGIRGRGLAERLAAGDIAGPFETDDHTLHYGPLLGACPLIPEIVIQHVRDGQTHANEAVDEGDRTFP